MLICCICLPDASFSLWSQEVSPKPTPATKAGLIIAEKAGTTDTSDGVGKRASRLSQSLRCLCVEISILTICGVGDQVQLEVPGSWGGALVNGVMPGSGECWLLLACMPPSSAHSCLPARCHHAMIQHESCHQVHRLHLGLTRRPEPKGTTPLS